MKKPILTVALAVFLIQGIILTGCNSSSQKAENAKENVQEAREDLSEAKQEANTAIVKAANEQEWKEFKIDAEARIKKNELRISQEKSKLKRNGNNVDEAAKQRIDALETRNAEFTNRINNYEKNQTDWETFKLEFNRDMDELGNAFNNLTVDNR
jgi:chromosome segregation ATPase